MQASQDIRVGGRFGAAQYQFTMQGDNLRDLQVFGPRMLQELRTIPVIADVNTDQQNNGLQSYVQVDRATAARFGISSQLVDNTLYDAFGEREVSTMYTPLNQYYVIMVVEREFWQNPLFLRQLYAYAPNGQEVPFSAFAHFSPITAPLSVNHQGLSPSVTISFNLQPGVALGDAADAITDQAPPRLACPRPSTPVLPEPHRPMWIHLSSEPLLILAALSRFTWCLGILYESYVHPVTILSTCRRRGWARCWR